MLGTVLDNSTGLRADVRAHSIYSDPKPKRAKPRSYPSSATEKPRPTCYAPMTKHVSSGGYTCPKHGKPSRP